MIQLNSLLSWEIAWQTPKYPEIMLFKRMKAGKITFLDCPFDIFPNNFFLIFFPSAFFAFSINLQFTRISIVQLISNPNQYTNNTNPFHWKVPKNEDNFFPWVISTNDIFVPSLLRSRILLPFPAIELSAPELKAYFLLNPSSE